MSTASIEILQRIQSLDLGLRMITASFFALGIVTRIMMWTDPALSPVWKDRTQKTSDLFYFAATLCLFAHTCMAMTTFSQDTIHLTLSSVACVLSVSAWVLVHVLGAKFEILSSASAILSFILIIIASFIPDHVGEPLSPVAYPKVLSSIHILSAISASGLMLIACCTSFIYLTSYSLLKKKSTKALTSIPSLEKLDHVIFWCTGVGLIIMSLSLISGIGLSLNNVTGQNLLPKLIWSVGCWFIYTCSLLGRVYFGWQPKRTAITSLCGTLLLSLFLFGSIWV